MTAPPNLLLAGVLRAERTGKIRPLLRLESRRTGQRRQAWRDRSLLELEIGVPDIRGECQLAGGGDCVFELEAEGVRVALVDDGLRE